MKTMSSNGKSNSATIRRSISTPGTALSNWRTLQHIHSNSLQSNDMWYERIDPTLASLSLSATHSPNDATVKHKSFDFTNSPLMRYDFCDGLSAAKADDILDVLRVSPEDLASQMTLIDLPIFKAIDASEFTSLGWSGPQKLKLTPNIVKFTQRFNRVSFWVVQEVLSHKSVKQRAEILTHLIKVAKRLHDLNNIHSTFAVVSALTSAPIHRLSKTWAYISNKNKSAFERLSDLFSDSNNFERLREYLSNAKTPCIPYLGVFLHDIIYIDIAHPSSRGIESSQRRMKFDNLLRIIAEFQRSSYDHLPVLPNVQKYLSSVRYIEELQKFLEDDNYKTSLKLEPPETDSRHNVSYNRESSVTVRSLNESTTHANSPNLLSVNYYDNMSQFSQYDANNSNSMPGFTKKVSNFIPGHRKARSLGTNVTNVLSSISLSSMTTPSSPSVAPTITQNAKNRCLIDDSVINEDAILLNCDINKPSLPTFEVIYDDDEDREAEADDANADEDMPLKKYKDLSVVCADEKVLFQGSVKRKTVLKDGKKPSISSWVRYWLVLKGTHLLFYNAKCFKDCHRNEYRSNPIKWLSLEEWIVAHVEESSQPLNTFTLSDIAGLNVYKFRTPESLEWYKRITQTLSQLKSSAKSSYECLIDLN